MAEELKLMGTQEEKQSWFSKYLGQIMSSILAKFASAFTLTVNRLDTES
jgi:hypothetical protein